MTTPQPTQIKPTIAPEAILIAVTSIDQAKALKQATEAIDQLLANPQLSSAQWWTQYNKHARCMGEALFVA